MLCVYGHYKYCNVFSAGPSLTSTGLRQMILTYKDGPALKRLNKALRFPSYIYIRSGSPAQGWYIIILG